MQSSQCTQLQRAFYICLYDDVENHHCTLWGEIINHKCDMKPHMTWAYLLGTVHIKFHAAHFLKISWQQSFKKWNNYLSILITLNIPYQLICES